MESRRKPVETAGRDGREFSSGNRDVKGIITEPVGGVGGVDVHLASESRGNSE